MFAVAAWEDIGCYKDNWSRALGGEIHRLRTNLTRQMCVGICTDSVRLNMNL